MLNRREFFKVAVIFALFPSGCTWRKTNTLVTRKTEPRKEVESRYPYVITEPCKMCEGIYDEPQCAAVCPVDCISSGYLRPGDKAYKKMFYIDPYSCICCGACEPECPVNAIFPADKVPEKWKQYIRYNELAFIRKESNTVSFQRISRINWRNKKRQMNKLAL